MPRLPKSRRWLKMGVELEGSWDTDYRKIAQEVRGAQAKTDGSLAGLPNYMGEITTRPHTILDHLCEDVTKLYPDNINDGCGYHIHVSFNPLDYSLLADKPFWVYFRERFHAWGEANQAKMGSVRTVFWDRYNGRGDRAQRYCKAEFKPEEQLRDHNDRYTQLNFTAWHKFQTLEVRMLPMFNKQEAGAELACGATRELSDICDTYLNEHEFPEMNFKDGLKDVGELVLEEHKLRSGDRSYFEEVVATTHPAIVRGEDVLYHIAGAQELMLPWVTQVRTNEP